MLRWTLAVSLFAAMLAMSRPANAFDAKALQGSDPPPNAMWLDSLGVKDIVTGGYVIYVDGKEPHARLAYLGGPLILRGETYLHGIGTRAHSELMIDLKRAATRFVTMAGLDDTTSGYGSVTYEVWLDGRKVLDTGVIRGIDQPRLLSVDVTGARYMTLVITDAGDGADDDFTDWAGAMLELVPGARFRPAVAKVANEPPPPIASGNAPAPAIHGPRIVGATPGRPFLFLIPATGEAPLEFSARNLPAGLSLDSRTGIITGALQRPGTTAVELEVKGPRGSARRTLTIIGGDHKLALTPPMGWSSWNIWGPMVTDRKVRDAADWMVRSGLAAHGYQYINIDDTWSGERDANGELTGNSRFPDMKALGDYVHAKGLKFGVYSSPGRTTCLGYPACYGHEEQDAKTFAKWGVDYLKYDWCSYGDIVKDDDWPEVQKPYRVMRAALDKCGRDIVYSICQYGFNAVYVWGPEVGGNLWRTNTDLPDKWTMVAGIGFGEDSIAQWAGPGHWNDPDMMVVGKMGRSENPVPTALTPNEQITHVTLWSMLAAPMLLGCDLSRLDTFTLDLLTNDEVIDVNQDPLGKQARRGARTDWTEVWSRPLWDGTLAVGLFNRGPKRTEVVARWSDLGLRGRHPVRDLWQQKDLGVFGDSFTAQVPAHGAALVKVGR